MHTPEIIGIRAQLFAAAIGDPKIVFEAQPTATWPVNARLDSENHSFANCARARLMRIGWLVRAGANSVTDGVRWLAGVSPFCNSGANQVIQLGKACSVLCKAYGFVENLQQQVEQTVVLGRQLARAQILREVRP